MNKKAENLAKEISDILNNFASSRTRSHLQLLYKKLNMGIGLVDLINSGYITDVTVTGLSDLERTSVLVNRAVLIVKENPEVSPMEMWYQMLIDHEFGIKKAP